jgi:amidohydrolase
METFIRVKSRIKKQGERLNSISQYVIILQPIVKVTFIRRNKMQLAGNFIRTQVVFGLLAIAFLAVEPVKAQTLGSVVEAELPSLAELYKHFHSTPELSCLEKETSAELAAHLREAGYEVTHPVGRFSDSTRISYGVVAILKNGSGPTVMVRGDMDALPLEEKTGLPYASKVSMADVNGQISHVMHACGHDMHTTVLVGTARALVKMRSLWAGTLILIGQPAEEFGAGARAMLAGGLYERWPVPDYVIAEHVDPGLEAGRVGYRPGWAMANVNSVDILIRGIGAHGARPHQGRDPIVIAAQVINALQTIVSREIDPVETGVVTVGSIHGGTKHNIIPDEVRLQLTVRSYTDEVRRNILKAVERITINTCRAAGVPEDRLPVITSPDEFTPALYNDPDLAGRLAGVLRKTLGEENVVEIPPTTGGEDFSEYGRTEHKVPILMLRLGSAQSGSDPLTRPGLHNPNYYPVFEMTIRTGVKTMTAAVLDLMKK